MRSLQLTIKVSGFSWKLILSDSLESWNFFFTNVYKILIEIIIHSLFLCDFKIIMRQKW